MITFEAKVSPDLFALIPNYSRTVVTCTMEAEPDRLAPVPQVGQLLSAARLAVEHAARTVVEPWKNGPFGAWRDAFRLVGINPSKYRPAPEALARRAAQGQALGVGLPLVDLGTAVSLETTMPIGVHCVDDLDPSDLLELRFASGSERFLDFQGNLETVDPSEVVYAAGQTVLTRRWVWRQGPTGSVDAVSRRLAVNIDSLSAQRPTTAIELTMSLLNAAGARDINVHQLTSNCPTRELQWR